MLSIDCPFDPADVVLRRILASAAALNDLTLKKYPESILTLPVPLPQLKRLVCEPNEPSAGSRRRVCSPRTSASTIVASAGCMWVPLGSACSRT